MTIPDKLIQAARLAICTHQGIWERCNCKAEARMSLVAAFAALPECEEARLHTVKALTSYEGEWFIEKTATPSPTTGEPMPGIRPWPLADVALAALAKLAES